MFISSLAQRQALFDLSQRWLYNQLLPSDPKTLQQLFAQEATLSRQPFHQFLDAVLQTLQPNCTAQVCTHKEQLRAILSQQALRSPVDSSRARGESYLDNPDAYFPRTPVEMTLYCNPNQEVSEARHESASVAGASDAPAQRCEGLARANEYQEVSEARHESASVAGASDAPAQRCEGLARANEYKVADRKS
ncbi:MAG: hypothetical protein RBU37_15195, partial [Myxococcota bacterium]|nr:hypothetical protein [Myxococcota bacterium]